MNKETIGPCRAGHRVKPAIAHGKFSRQSRKHRQLLRRKTFHDLAGMFRIDGSIIQHEAAIIDLRISALKSAELHLDITELVPRIMRHRPVGRRGNSDLIATRVKIPIPRRVQPIDSSRLPGPGVGSTNIGEAEQMIKGPVFQHQHKHMFDAVGFLLAVYENLADDKCQLYAEQPEKVDQVRENEAGILNNSVERHSGPVSMLLDGVVCPLRASIRNSDQPAISSAVSLQFTISAKRHPCTSL